MAEPMDLRAEVHDVLKAIMSADTSEDDAGFQRTKYIQELQSLYDQNNQGSFLEVLKLSLVKPFLDDRRGRVALDIDRLLENVAAIKYSSDDLQEMLSYTLRGAQAGDNRVRFRCTQMTAFLLNHAPSIPEDIRDELLEIMLERARDKIVAIRVQSIYALKHLQEEKEDDPATSAILRLAVTDPSKDIRVAAVENVAVQESTIGDLLIRIRDICSEVRVAIFNKLAMVEKFDLFSPADRIHLVDQGMHDRDEAAASACQTMVLSWLRQCNGSLVLLFQSMNVDKASKACSELCQWLLKEHADLINVPNIKDKALLGEDLSFVESFIWKEQCIFYQATSDEALEILLPGIPAYCDLLRHIHNSYQDAEDQNDKDRLLLVGQHVLMLGQALDFQDEVGRRQLILLLLDCFGNSTFESVWIGDAVKLLAIICRTTESEFIQYMTETISDLYDNMQEMPTISPSKRAELTTRLDAIDEKLENSKLPTEQYDALHAEAIALEKELEEPKTLLWLRCLELTAKLLQLTRQSLRNATIAGVLHMILPAVDSDIPALREKGLECLGLYSLLDRVAKMASQHSIVFWRVLNADDEDGDAKRVCIDFLMDFFAAYPNFEVPPCIEDGETVTSSLILDGLSSYFCLDQTNLDDWDLPTQTVVVRGFCKLFLLKRITDLEKLQSLLELYFHPFLKKMVHSNRHGFCSETLQVLSVFYPTFARKNCQLIQDACHHVLSRALYGVSSVPFEEAAAYLLQLLSHPQTEGNQCKINHHNRVSEWCCIEMLALEELTSGGITKKVKKELLHQWWTLLQNLDWSIKPITTEHEEGEDEDKLIKKEPNKAIKEPSEKVDEDNAENTTSAVEEPSEDVQTANPPNETSLLFVLFEEVASLMPENTKFKAKMKQQFGENFICPLSDETSEWIMNAVTKRKEVLSKGEYKSSLKKTSHKIKKDDDDMSEESEEEEIPTKVVAREKTTRQSKSAATVKLQVQATDAEVGQIEDEVVQIDDSDDDDEAEAEEM
ncbi:condensin complex subunit 3 [Thraustotheca clavata]|uniref:Condensin complex subunit 3 n=1 Tax=Thraustotheca clavata TaxID=74557 RepID=A0A1W0A114_9STRA|nr:condensin complex subunit 3 [Thraustotheca clavata]